MVGSAGAETAGRHMRAFRQAQTGAIIHALVIGNRIEGRLELRAVGDSWLDDGKWLDWGG